MTSYSGRLNPKSEMQIESGPNLAVSHICPHRTPVQVVYYADTTMAATADHPNEQEFQSVADPLLDSVSCVLCSIPL
jgi:hypothetical protein